MDLVVFFEKLANVTHISINSFQQLKDLLDIKKNSSMHNGRILREQIAEKQYFADESRVVQI